MEFKSSDAVFKDKNCFVDDMKRFMCDEAARFTTGGNEAASASIDEFAERGVRFSIEKNKRAIKQQKQAIKELDAKKEELLKTEMESIHPSEKEVSGGDSSSSYSSSEKDSKENKESSSHQASEKEKELDSKKEKAKKEKSKEAKKAGAKTAVANLLKAKAEMSNDLVGNKVTGDALKDGNTGMMKLLTHALNPMTYMKKLVAYIGAAIAPYILAFMAIASVVLIIVMFMKLTLAIISAMAAVIVWIIGTGLGIDVVGCLTGNVFGQILLFITGILYLMVGIKMFGTDKIGG